MILIEAIIKPFKLDDLKDALDELGVGGLTITEVLQTSQSRWRRPSASTDAGPDTVPKVKVEIAVPEELAPQVIEAICIHGSSGRSEDGLAVVQRMVGVIRIRTGEEGPCALLP